MKWSFATVMMLAVLMLSMIVVRARTGTITGIVTDGSDAGAPVPLPGATVEVTSADGIRSSATTDLNGRYELTRLASGIHTVKFTFRAYANEERRINLTSDSPREIDVCMAPRDITGIALSAAADVTGVVRDSSTCRTLGNVIVEVRRQGRNGSAPIDSTATSEAGTYEFSQLDPDNYTVKFSAENYEDISSGVEVRLGAAQPLHAYMPPRFRLLEERDEFGINPKTTTEFPWISPVDPECRGEDCPEPLPPGRSPNPHPRVGITFRNDSEGGTRPPRPPHEAPPVTIWSNRPPR